MQKDWKPLVAGVLAIIGGAINLLVALGISLFVPVAVPFPHAFVSVGAVALLWLASGVVAVAGGVSALQRRRWGLSLAGAFCAIVPPATLLGIVSTVFTALAREEFVSSSAGPKQGGTVPPVTESAASSVVDASTSGNPVSEPDGEERNA